MRTSLCPFILPLLLLMAIAVFISCKDKNNDTGMEKGIVSALAAKGMLPPKPRMWVDMSTSIGRVNNFTNIRPDLTAIIGITRVKERAFLFYDTMAFKKMIRHFRSLDYTYLDVIIANENNLLTLYFHPIARARTLDYYTLPDKATDFNPRHPDYLIKKEVLDDLVRDYTNTGANTKMKFLRGLLDDTDPFNHESENASNPLLNTLSIRYDSASISEMYNEIYYQDTANNNQVSGIQANFALIGPDGYTTGDDIGSYKRRLLVYFEFTKRNNINGQHEVFYLDTTRHKNDPYLDFNQRTLQKTVVIHETDPIWFYKNKGLDNGQLCPANCP